ncbi:MAG: hypothetical protein ACRDSZ_19100 [Pseudonocardiaceae bacterium]
MKFGKVVMILLGVIVGVTLVGVIALRLEPVQRLIQDKLYDNVPSFSACDRLPSASAVQSALDGHADLVTAIRQVAPDEVTIEPDTQRCGDDRAEILITYGTHDQRIRIQALLAEGGFSDVPVSLRNV